MATGIIFNFGEDLVDIFLFQSSIPVAELEVARRTDGGVYKTIVGIEIIGRVINARGLPLDGLGDIKAAAYHPIEVLFLQLLNVVPLINH